MQGDHRRQLHALLINGYGVPRLRFLLLAAFALAGATLTGAHHGNAAGVTERASVSSDEAQSNHASNSPAVSANGRFVAFSSRANLTPEDTDEELADIYIRDLQTGTTELVSKSTAGDPGNGSSTLPSISADGRYIAFMSSATNLVTPDTNVCGIDPTPGSCLDVFVRDRTMGTTTMVSVKSDGVQGNGQSTQPAISADGRFVVFHSTSTNLVANDTNGVSDVFFHNRVNGATSRVSISDDEVQGNGSSGDAFAASAVSADARYVAFSSLATNLVANDMNGFEDVFVRDRTAGTTTRISLGTSGAEGNLHSRGPSMSSDGRFIAFRATASNLVPDDTNGVQDIFLWDRTSGATTRVSVSSSGEQSNGPSSAPLQISANGSHVVFGASASNLVDGDSNTCPAPLSGTVGPCSDIFVRNLQSNQTERVNLALDGTTQANGYSINPSINANGLVIAFESIATNLVPGDTNVCGGVSTAPGSCSDIFVTNKVPSNGGGVTLQGRNSGSPGGGHALATVQVDGGAALPVSNEGIFSLAGVSPGEHTLLACAPGYLCAERDIDINGGVVTGGLPALTLRAGRVDIDTDVDINDVTAIIAAFGSRPGSGVDGQGRRVDVNFDGVVNLRDLTLTLGNFGRMQPQGWP